MATDPQDPFTIAFVGYTPDALAADAAAYEDALVPIYDDHGARLLYRGQRVEGQDEALPFEVHLTWFPNRAAFDAYLADPRRADLLVRFGEVFTAKEVVEVNVLSG